MITVRVAPWSERRVRGASGKVTAGAIKAALAGPDAGLVEFLDVLHGKPLTAPEARAMGWDSLTIRFNADRSVVVVRL